MKFSAEHSRWFSLFYVLVHKDIRVRFKQTFLGIAWALFQPLVMMGIFSFIFTQVATIDTKGIPYPLFVYIGILPWTFFQQALLSSTSSLIASASIFTRIYVPKAVFPLSAIAGKFLDLLLSFGMLMVMFVYYRYLPHGQAWICLPYFLNQMAFTVGLGMILSMGNLFYRDVGFVMSVIVQLWMFITPVLYPIPTAGKYAWLLRLNPMAHILDVYRHAIFDGMLPELSDFILNTFICWAVAWIGWKVFHRYEHLFAERV